MNVIIPFVYVRMLPATVQIGYDVPSGKDKFDEIHKHPIRSSELGQKFKLRFKLTS